ncbi:MAG: hypothetical protein KBT36_12475 [Kurthia sp.]|nr:hypothetical protein [Candidatus Kurthia equi]
MVTVKELVEKAEELTTKGLYEDAIRLYADAIKIESSNSNLYRAYGKVAYLMEENQYAIAAYLSALHIEIAKIEHFGLTEQTKPMYDNLPQNLKDELPKVGGLVVFYDTNTLRHLAHAITDFDENAMNEEPKLLAFKQIYHAELSGNADEYNDALHTFNRTPSEASDEDASFYIHIGKELAMAWIKWDQLNSLDVGNLYFPK